MASYEAFIIKMIWLKFNIYSFLLGFIGAGFIAFAVLNPFGHTVLISSVCIVIACFLCQKSIRIFSKYNYKKEIFIKLVEKSRKRYDQRYFIPYMGSPCMRSVVFFSLCELNREQDYSCIKKRAFSDGNVFEKPRVVHVRSEKDGKLVFSAYDEILKEMEEI